MFFTDPIFWKIWWFFDAIRPWGELFLLIGSILAGINLVRVAVKRRLLLYIFRLKYMALMQGLNLEFQLQGLNTRLDKVRGNIFYSSLICFGWPFYVRDFIKSFKNTKKLLKICREFEKQLIAVCKYI